MNSADLVALSEDDLDDHIAWIDWRSEEEEVVNSVRELIGEELKGVWDETRFMVRWNSSVYEIPLLLSRVDQYIIICSLAEILKEKFSFFLRDGYEGSDTHGLLVVTRECAAELEARFKEWLEKNFVPLNMGVDNFSGVKIPYYGNEDNNPNLREELKELKASEADLEKFYRESPEIAKITRKLRIQLGTATFKDKLIYYPPRYWWVAALLLVWWWLK